MKWVLVVLIGGVAPVQTDVVFEKLSDCLAAEEQLQQAYADAYAGWNRRFMADDDRSERRRGRDYRRARDTETRRLANTGTCIPHAGTDQPITSLNGQSAPSSAPSAAAPSPTPSETPKP